MIRNVYRKKGLLYSFHIWKLNDAQFSIHLVSPISVWSSRTRERVEVKSGTQFNQSFVTDFLAGICNCIKGVINFSKACCVMWKLYDVISRSKTSNFGKKFLVLPETDWITKA